MKIKFLRKRTKVFIAAFALSFTNITYAEGSLWDSFVNFFSSKPAVVGEGPLYDELRELDNKISRTEGKYSRERRPINKERYKKELNQLQREREELLKKIEVQKNEPNKAQIAADSLSVDSLKTNKKIQNAISKSRITSKTTAEILNYSKACNSDTVYLRDTVIVKDTVVVHDTLLVMLAPKQK